MVYNLTLNPSGSAANDIVNVLYKMLRCILLEVFFRKVGYLN